MTTNAKESAATNPRRLPANRSVSLLHSPKHKVDRTFLHAQRKTSPNDSSVDTHNSPSSLQPNGGKGSSGESSNAERWFEKSNNHIRDTSTSFADNEPPYFLRNNSSSSDRSPATGDPKKAHNVILTDGAGSLPIHAALLHIGTDGSSTDDFRGVIDDLTIENKKLKRRLKKYEKLHDSHLKDEKLFEVRIHGLPAEKKRELEETLRKFAASLQHPGFPANGYEGLMPHLKTHVTSSSQTSMQNTDSAYASMSASGQGSSAHSGNEKKQKKFVHSAAARSRNIHTYLHQIPEGLLPNSNPLNLPDAAKKKLVVRRLEQIFSGKGATLDGHQQPMQQQEVSQSAALADRSAIEALGQRVRQEGNREAQIMQTEHDDTRISSKKAKMENGKQETSRHTTRSAHDGESSPRPAVEQRPTRPLDLDPHRAQIPADNLRYMRHLGFSPLDLDSSRSPEEGHGWIYLNLLINMAQLHTIHVTAEFVRKAVTELSDKFELSPDGRKIRWKGGSRHRGVESGAGSGSSAERTSEDLPADQSPRKRPKLGHRVNSARSVRSNRGQSQLGHPEANKLVYTPLFVHKDSTDEAEDSSSEEEDDDISSPFPAPVGGNSSGMTSSGVRTTSTKKQKKHDDGPIIFYNNARFCTDLSGERGSDGNPNAPVYGVVSVQPVGKPHNKSGGELEKRGPLEKASTLPEPMDLHDNPIPESMELSFPKSSPLPSQSPSSSGRTPIELEVTGIGGVWPADHFAIRIESRHARVPDVDAGTSAPLTTTKRVAPRLAGVLDETGRNREQGVVVDKKVVSSTRRDLAPSQLPPALSFMRFGEEDYSDDDSVRDDHESISPDSPVAFPPATMPQMMDLPMGSDSDEDSGSEDDDDDESDGSLDLLATAREADPEAIRAREREYDANMAERLAEEIPAGSSAATAGGGSGFASPASGVGRDEYRRAVRDARGRPASLQHARTSDSIVAHAPSAVGGIHRSDEDEDDDDDDDEEMNDASS